MLCREIGNALALTQATRDALSQRSAAPLRRGRVPLLSCSAPLEKMRGAERRQALVRNAAPVARLAVGPISGSPEITTGYAGRRASRRSAAAFSLRRRAALFGTGGPLWVRGRPAFRARTSAATFRERDQPPSASSWQGDIAPGRSPDAARVPVASRTTRAPPRPTAPTSRAPGRRIRGPVLRSRLRPAPPSRRLMRAPLGEQGRKNISRTRQSRSRTKKIQ